MVVFEVPMKGVVNTGHYMNTSHEFLWSVANDLGNWHYSKTFNTWFKAEEINFT